MSDPRQPNDPVPAHSPRPMVPAPTGNASVSPDPIIKAAQPISTGASDGPTDALKRATVDAPDRQTAMIVPKGWGAALSAGAAQRSEPGAAVTLSRPTASVAEETRIGTASSPTSPFQGNPGGNALKGVSQVEPAIRPVPGDVPRHDPVDFAPGMDAAPLEGRNGISAMSSPATVAMPSSARAEQVAAQIATTLAGTTASPDRAAPLEIALDPPELGNLRISVRQADDGIFLTVTIDRPETLELMRRHAGLLAQEFQRQGLDASGFSFAGGDGRTGAEHGQPGPAGDLPPADPPHPSATPAATTAAGDLDIRI